MFYLIEQALAGEVVGAAGEVAAAGVEVAAAAVVVAKHSLFWLLPNMNNLIVFVS